jgi:hypothetical protein
VHSLVQIVIILTLVLFHILILSILELCSEVQVLVEPVTINNITSLLCLSVSNFCKDDLLYCFVRFLYCFTL